MEGLEKVVSPAWTVVCAGNEELHRTESCKRCPSLWGSFRKKVPSCPWLLKKAGGFQHSAAGLKLGRITLD